MKSYLLLSLIPLLLIVPVIANGQNTYSDPKDLEPYVSFRGNTGMINSQCDNYTFQLLGSVSTESAFKIEVVNPSGKVVGAYEGQGKTAVDVQLDIDYAEEGMYDFLLYYEDKIYKLWSNGWDKSSKQPSRESQIQCLWSKEFNSQVTSFYPINREQNIRLLYDYNVESLMNLLGEEQFSFYEPIININDILDKQRQGIDRIPSDYANEQLLILKDILHTKMSEQISETFEISKNIISNLEGLTTQEKVDTIYSEQIRFEELRKIQSDDIDNFISKIQNQYRILDDREQFKIQQQQLEAEEQLKIEQEKERILKELEKEEQQKEIIREELEREEQKITQVTPEPELIEKSTSDSICGKGTIEQNGVCVVDPDYKQTTETKSRGGGCLIATATFGSEMAPQVQKLREIRDSKLLQTESGSQFMESFNTFYYSFSPIIADYERENPVFKEVVKIGITPMISTLSLMDYADTESEVLGIGISLIILNAMMYVGLPVFGIIVARKSQNILKF